MTKISDQESELSVFKRTILSLFAGIQYYLGDPVTGTLWYWDTLDRGWVRSNSDFLTREQQSFFANYPVRIPVSQFFREMRVNSPVRMTRCVTDATVKQALHKLFDEYACQQQRGEHGHP